VTKGASHKIDFGIVLRTLARLRMVERKLKYSQGPMKRLLFIVILTVSFFSSAAVSSSIFWDDQFIFLRYAKNLIEFGEVTFNPHDGWAPTNGATSLLHLILLTIIQPFYSGSDELVSPLHLSMVWSMVFSATFAWLSIRALFAGNQIALAGVGLIVSMIPLASNVGQFALNGLETCMSVVVNVATCMLILCMWCRDDVRRKDFTWLSGLYVISVFVRPDLIVMYVGAIAALWVLDLRQLRKAILLVIPAGFSFLIFMIVNQILFKMWLPLTHNVKSSGYYGPVLDLVYNGVREYNQYMYVCAVAPVILLTLYLNGRQGSSDTVRRARLSFLVAGSVLIPTITYGMNPIAGSFGRFLQLADGLFFASVFSLIREIAESKSSLVMTVYKFSASSRRALNLVTCCLAAVFLYEVKIVIDKCDDNIRIAYHENSRSYWPCLDYFEKILRPRYIAATEIGVLGMKYMDSNIIDMAGLVTARVPYPAYSPLPQIEQFKPELIFFPHPDYDDMYKVLLNSESFLNQYQVYDAKAHGGTELEFAVRKDIPNFADIDQTLELDRTSSTPVCGRFNKAT